MSNLIKCKICNKIMIQEETKSHIMCYVDQTSSKTIYASHVSTLKINDGENCHLVTGLDGVTYRIIEREPDFIQFDPDQPTENTRHYTDKDDTRGLHRT